LKIKKGKNLDVLSEMSCFFNFLKKTSPGTMKEKLVPASYEKVRFVFIAYEFPQ